MMMTIVMTAVLMMGAPVKTRNAADPAANRAAVRQAALDYVQALYAVDPTKVARIVWQAHPPAR